MPTSPPFRNSLQIVADCGCSWRQVAAFGYFLQVPSHYHSFFPQFRESPLTPKHFTLHSSNLDITSFITQFFLSYFPLTHSQPKQLHSKLTQPYLTPFPKQSLHLKPTHRGLCPSYLPLIITPSITITSLSQFSLLTLSLSSYLTYQTPPTSSFEILPISSHLSYPYYYPLCKTNHPLSPQVLVAPSLFLFHAVRA